MKSMKLICFSLLNSNEETQITCYLVEVLTNWTTKIGCLLSSRYDCIYTVCFRYPVLISCLACWVGVSWWQLSLSPFCCCVDMIKSHWVNKMDLGGMHTLFSVPSPGKASHTCSGPVNCSFMFKRKLILKRKHLIN